MNEAVITLNLPSRLLHTLFSSLLGKLCSSCAQVCVPSRWKAMLIQISARLYSRTNLY
jgi:hypothetical protein